MANKQTAVEWFFDKLENHEIQARHYDLYQQAKAMEKEQIIEAYEEGDCNGTATEWGYEVINAEQYYEETYGK